ncbi:MAG: mechanosensitive ion channel [Vicinamibacterales bacterium]
MPEHALTLLAIVSAFAIAALIVAAGHLLVHRTLDTMETVSPESRKALHERAQRLLGALRLLAFGVAALGSISLGMQRFGGHRPDVGSEGDGEMAADARRQPDRHRRRCVNRDSRGEPRDREPSAAALAAPHAVGPRVAAARQHARRHPHECGDGERRTSPSLMLLRELGLDVVPILTGAGIAGLAIGFGAQNLVRDVISGFFLILEDQVRVGDIARINGVSGVVEQINLRTIVLRDGEGAVQVFPNETVNTLANLSKQFAYAVVDLRIAWQKMSMVCRTNTRGRRRDAGGIRNGRTC